MYLKFTGGSGALFNFNWWKFTPRDPLPDADGGATDGAGWARAAAGPAAKVDKSERPAADGRARRDERWRRQRPAGRGGAAPALGGRGGSATAGTRR